MPAKSVPATTPGQVPARLALTMRQILTPLILIVGLFILAWMFETRLGVQLLGSTYTRVLEHDDGPAVAVRNARTATPADEARFRALAEFLARRYKVSNDVTYDLVGIAHAVGHKLGLDPLLIISVMAVESRFNPIAESEMGAKGLMQVIPAYHKDKLEEYGGVKSVYDPETNIIVGARILKEYFQRTGHLGMALQMYAGALQDENDVYSNRVFGEHERLRSVVTRLAKSSPLQKASAQRKAVVASMAPL